jgi:hypothetical protein
MEVRSHADAFLSQVQAAYWRSLEDAANAARRNHSAPGDTRAELTGPLKGRIGSTRPYAKAQELGAFIVPVRRRMLKFRDGTFHRQARLKAKHYLRTAARKWPSLLESRLREVGR